MLEGTTPSGFAYAIPKKRLKNYEVLEAIAEYEDNPLVFPKVVRLLLGDQAEQLKAHLRDEDGIVDSEAMIADVMAIFTNHKDLKN